MSGLVEELVDQEAEDLAAMVQLPSDQADPALAAMWEDTVRRGDLMQILGTAWLWSSKEVIARAVCACVRTVIDRVPTGEQRPLRALQVTERWSCANATLAEVAHVWQEANACASDTGDPVAEAAANAAGAAGENVIGFDEEALFSASRAVDAVVDIAGGSDPGARDRVRQQLVAIFQAAIPVPTLALMMEAHRRRQGRRAATT